MKLICLTASLTSCAFNPKKLTPHFIDTDRMTCRKYVVAETNPEIVFKFDSEHPIQDCNGFLSLPLDQALEIKRAYEKSHLKTSGPVPTETIPKELFILNGFLNEN